MKILTYLSLFILSSAVCYAQEFISTWKTDAGQTNVKFINLPINLTSGSYDIDWGDGNMETGLTGQRSHAYANTGTYTVVVDFTNATGPSISLAGNGEAVKLMTIEAWGDVQWSSMSNAFRGCSNLQINATDAPDLTNVLIMDRMFEGAIGLNSDLNNWDVSNVISMDKMFKGANTFNGDITGWNVSSVEYFGEMFYGASSFNQDIGDWDLSSASLLWYMFFRATEFNQDIGDWELGTASDLRYMFADAKAFNQSINGWDVSGVTNMEGMFQGAEAFNQDLNLWNVEVVENMSNMFASATSFNGDITSWNLLSLQSINSSWFDSGMFYNASSFNQDISGWDVSGLTDLGGMFLLASSFNQDISDWDVGNVTDMSSMFASTSSFNQSLNGWDVSKVENMTSMFSRATAFNSPLNLWNTSNVESMSSMFDGATTFNQNLNDWDVTSVSGFVFMFKNATSFNMDLTGWVILQATSLAGMFDGATAFNGNIANWNIANIENLNLMFHNATSFNGNIGIWNVSSVVSMYQTFLGATSFDQDISDWDVSMVINFNEFFGEGSGLSSNNYDKLLEDWNTLDLYDGLTFNAGNSQFTLGGLANRVAIVSDDNWTIVDDGPDLLIQEVNQVDENTEGVFLNLGFNDGTGNKTDDGVTYSLPNNSDNLRFEIDENNGELTFVNTPNFESPIDNNGDNNYEIYLETNIGSTQNFQSIIIEVLDINEAPEITNTTLNDVFIQTGDEFQVIDLSQYFEDPEVDNLSYVVQSSNSDVVSLALDESNLTLTEIGTGVSNVTLTAVDPMSLEVSRTFEVRVNSAPVAITIPDLTLNAGFSSHEIDLSQYFTDNEGDDLTYGVGGSGTVISATVAGSILTIVEISPGTVNLEVAAFDEYATQTSQFFDITVGVLAVEDEVSFKVFPNPTSDYIQLDNDSQVEVQLYDFNGKRVMRRQIERGDIIDIQSLKPGNYILQVSNRNEPIFSEKVVKIN